MNIWYLHPNATPYEIPGLHRPFEFGDFLIEEDTRLLYLPHLIYITQLTI